MILLLTLLFLTLMLTVNLLQRYQIRTSTKEEYARVLFTFDRRPTNLTGTILARAFDFWPAASPLPCYPAEEGWNTRTVINTPAQHGLLFLKPYKTASSTAAGVHLRMARNEAARRGMTERTAICKARFGHGPTKTPAAVLFPNRTRHGDEDDMSPSSFLWTIVREPTHRVISQFFHFSVSRRKHMPTDANFQSFLLDQKNDKWTRDYYLRTLYAGGKYDIGIHDPTSVANDILREYDFIAVTERMDESLVALSMLLNVPMADMLYLEAKKHGSYDAGGYARRCTNIATSFVSEGMELFFHSAEWKDRIQHDLALYHAVNKSLDLTIDRLGREGFESKLVRFRNATRTAKEKCLDRTEFPCDKDGNFRTKTDCLWKDSACGMTCLDDIATEQDLW
jgi:Galactose-3-O-sulfotransferase